RKLTRVDGAELGHKRALASSLDVERKVILTLDVNQLVPYLGSFPSVRTLILARAIEIFYVGVFYCGADICQTPCHAPIMAHDNVGISRKAHSRDIEITDAQMSFIPQIRH